MFEQVYYNMCSRSINRRGQWESSHGHRLLHRHHIKPKHNEGPDIESNYAYLTVREHQLAHYLLYKMNGDINDLRSMHMLGCQLSSIQRKKVGEWCRDNNIGFFNEKWHGRREAALKGIQTQMNLKIGIFDPTKLSYHGKLGGDAGGWKKQMKAGTGIFDPVKKHSYACSGGKALADKYKSGELKMVLMTNGKTRSRVKIDDVPKFEKMGYVKGVKLLNIDGTWSRGDNGTKIWMTDGSTSVIVHNHDINKFVSKGFHKGRTIIKKVSNTAP